MIKLIKGEQVRDGAGVKLNRVIGTKTLENADPFLLLDEFRSDNKEDYIKGFPMHPHRGIETITYMIEGSFIHRDSKGNEGFLKPGEIQWMTAGKGILHEEMPAMEDGQLWGYQLWVNLPKKHKMAEPKYRHVKTEDIPVVKGEGSSVKIISGEYNGVEGPVKSYFSVDYFDVALRKGTFQKKAKGTNLIYVHTGRLTVISKEDKLEISKGDLCLIEDSEEFSISAAEAGFLYISGDPLNEPIARYGPIVMNTVDELLQSIDDFNNGDFDK